MIIGTWGTTRAPIRLPGVLVTITVAALVVALLLLGGAPASADPQERCRLTDRRLAETSGMVWTPEGVQVVNDSGNPSTVYRLNSRCAVVGEVPVDRDGRDVEDLARAGDGTLWLADIGDNRRARSTVAILRVSPTAPDGDETVTRLTYPDGAHDAETLLLPGDGRPVIVTKDYGGRSGVYTTDEPLGTASPVALRRVGEVAVPGVAVFGAGAYTGGAISADGRVVALRTYTDAWLYPAPRGTATADDVVAALTGTPVDVPLPGEAQGEAIAFAPDGTLLSAGETPDAGDPATLRAVPGAAQLAGGAAVDPPAPTPVPATRTGTPASGSIVVALGAGVAVLAGLSAMIVGARRR